jgi:hypothetical protein
LSSPQAQGAAVPDLESDPSGDALEVHHDNEVRLAVQRLLAQRWTEPTTGDKLGHYLLLEAVGEGAFAIVWRAEDTRSNTAAAVKVFRPLTFPVPDREAAAVRFYEGAAAMRKIDLSPRLVRLYEGPFFEGCHLWFAMEYLPDGDLAKALRSGSLNVKQKLQVVDDLLDALEVAHSGGVRHRDLRPPNVLLRREGAAVRAVLADFDISYYEHVLRARDSTVVPHGVVRYTPPEVFGASPMDMRRLLRRYENDLYALCISVFDMFAGDVSLSVERSLSELGMTLSKRKDIDFRTRYRVTKFCYAGFGSSERRRYRSVSDARRAWRSACAGPRLLEAIVTLALGLIVASALAWVLRYVHMSALTQYAASATAIALFMLRAAYVATGNISRSSNWAIGLAVLIPEDERPPFLLMLLAAAVVPWLAWFGVIPEKSGSQATASASPSATTSVGSERPERNDDGGYPGAVDGGNGSMVDPGTDCSLPTFRHGAARRYLATSDSEQGAIFLKRQVSYIVSQQPNGRIWTTAFASYTEVRPNGQAKWVVAAHSMDPGVAAHFCDWLVRCKGWGNICSEKSPINTPTP